MRLAEFAEAEIPDWRNFRPVEVVRQFSLSLERELNFASECRNSEVIARSFAGYTDRDIASAGTSRRDASRRPDAL